MTRSTPRIAAWTTASSRLLHWPFWHFWHLSTPQTCSETGKPKKRRPLLHTRITRPLRTPDRPRQASALDRNTGLARSDSVWKFCRAQLSTNQTHIPVRPDSLDLRHHNLGSGIRTSLVEHHRQRQIRSLMGHV